MSERTLEIELLLKDKQALSRLNSALQGIESKSKQAASSFSDVWVKAAASIFVAERAFKAAGTFIQGAIGPAVAFEAAFSGVRKTVDATDAEFAQLSGRLREMSTRIPIAATELARIQELAGQLGVRGVDNLTKFTETIAKISVSTNLTEEAAATAFARLSNIMGEPISNIDRMGSVVVELGNNFATTESEILDFAQRMAGAGKIAGLTTADVMGIGTAMASVGVEAEAGGTAVQKVLIELKKRGKEGSDEFVKFVDSLRGSGKEGIRILEDMGLGNERVIRAFLSLANSGDLLERALQSANAEMANNTALNEEAAKKFEITQSKIILAQNAFNNLRVEIGEGLLPITNELLDVFTQVTIKLTEMQDQSGVVVDSGMGGITGFFANMVKNMDQFTRTAASGGLTGLVGEAAAQNVSQGTDQAALVSDEEDLKNESVLQKRAELHEQLEAMEAEHRTLLTESFFESETQKLEQQRTMLAAWNDEKQGAALAAIQHETEFLNVALDAQRKAHQSLWVAVGSMKDTFASGVSKMFVDMTKGTFDAKTAFMALGESMLQILIDWAVQKAINFAVGKAMAAAEIATATATGAAVAAAWAPAAAFVSLATFGANAAGASAALTSTVGLAGALAKAGAIAGLEEGGTTTSAGTVLVGESGPEFLNLPRGATVTPLSSARGGGGDTFIDIQINNPHVSNQSEAESLFEQLAERLNAHIEQQRRDI